eukprot:2910471-Pyramimonas_sp.AAC.1
MEAVMWSRLFSDWPTMDLDVGHEALAVTVDIPRALVGQVVDVLEHLLGVVGFSQQLAEPSVRLRSFKGR